MTRSAALLLLLVFVAGCDLLSKNKDYDVATDTARAAVLQARKARADSATVARVDSVRAARAKTAAVVRIRPAVPHVRTDTVGAIATPLELTQLGATLDVPVQGVARNQLRDSYTEARSGHLHQAMDILAPRGTVVVSATDGRLLKLFNSKAGGLMVYATDVSEHFILLYGHLDHFAAGLTDGMPLKRGQTIGYVGTTGNAPPGTPHLHFGILRGDPSVSWSKGVAVNPYLVYMAAK